MRPPLKENKENLKSKDDTLFGLLSVYKAHNTYFRILLNEVSNNLKLSITSNPKKWQKLGEETIKDYRLIKRSEIGTEKLFVKYLTPENLIDQLGPMLGLKLPEGEVKIINNLDSNGVYSLELNSQYLQEIISIIEKIIDFPPEKKYEIIEKSLSGDPVINRS
jgi:hypothetical protein